jgi:Na+/proline symporter
MPPLLIAIWCIIDLKAYKISFKFSKDELIAKIKSIKWYHIIFVVLVAVVGIVYIKRSGNSGNASSIEMAMRNALEEIFYVRPRTKEFMLGYPAILIAFFMLKRNIKNAQYLLIVGSIGTMSTVNTFTHLHTPIVYSLLRSIYGIVLGLVLGYAVIIIVGQTMKFIRKKKEL